MSERTVYCINWTEYERGFGHRPDGHTLHVTRATANAYRAAFLSRQPDQVPDEYSSPSEPFLVEVTDEVADEVARAGSIWGHAREQKSRADV